MLIIHFYTEQKTLEHASSSPLAHIFTNNNKISYYSKQKGIVWGSPCAVHIYTSRHNVSSNVNCMRCFLFVYRSTIVMVMRTTVQDSPKRGRDLSLLSVLSSLVTPRIIAGYNFWSHCSSSPLSIVSSHCNINVLTIIYIRRLALYK